MQRLNKLKLTHRRVGHSILCAATALTCVSLYADHDKTSSDKDTSFLNEAARGGKMEVELGRLGSQKGQSTEVKQFGERLVNDHTKANDELMQLAQKKGITLDTASGHKDMALDQFSSKSGADFDKAFTKHMIKDHKKDISKFEKEAAETSDPDVKAFVNKTLPTLREHLQTAQSIGRTLGLDEKSITLNEDNYTVEPTANAGGAVNVQTETKTDKDRKDLGLTTGINTEPSRADQTSSSLDNNRSADTTSSYNGSRSADTSSTYNGSRSADTSASAATSMDNTSTSHKSKMFSTDKNDGKLWGIIPWHRKHNSDTESVGAPPSGTSESSTEHVVARRLSFNDVPKPVQDTITAQGGTTDQKNIKKEIENGKTVYCLDVKRQGEKVKLRINEDGSLESKTTR